MSISDQFQIALEAYQDIVHDDQTDLPKERPGRVSRQPASSGPLPAGSLFLGMAADGLPVVLDLHAAGAGPLLLIASDHSGKTAFLQSIPVSLNCLPNQEDIQFGVLTDFPDEWSFVEGLPNCLGIWPAYHRSCGDFLARLMSWAEVLSATRQSVLLLVDGIDLMTEMTVKCRHDLRWLLTNGPENHIWPIVTLNAKHAYESRSWLSFFHSIIYGHTEAFEIPDSLVGESSVNLPYLDPGSEFVLQSSDGGLKFRIFK